MPDELTNWLEEIGLGEHAAAFVENSVDRGLLPHLTNEDLKDLGIIKLGDRKKLLLAIEQLSLNAGLAGNGGAEQNTIEGRGLEAERRQLTVMFVDLVGSTALSSRLDPEDLRALMRRYQAAVAGVIGISGGYLANWLGDGAIAYFGWPTAREDQAAESVRAGLAVVDAVSAVPVDDGSGEYLAARVGIATG
jgi:class 3 adenylate cyclase